MANATNSNEPRRTISFCRGGVEPFEGEFYVRGGYFEDFVLRSVSSSGRIPQDACTAVQAAKACLESGQPGGYERAVAALRAVSQTVVADWWG